MAIPSIGSLIDEEIIGSWFSVELDNGIAGHFTKVGGLTVDVVVVDVVDSMGDTVARKRPGQINYGEITLERTLSPDKAFWTWAKSIRDGEKKYRTDGAIVMHDIAGAPIGRWSFMNAWPSTWSASDLDVGTDDPMLESITLSIEFLKREQV